MSSANFKLVPMLLSLALLALIGLVSAGKNGESSSSQVNEITEEHANTSQPPNGDYAHMFEGFVGKECVLSDKDLAGANRRVLTKMSPHFEVLKDDPDLPDNLVWANACKRCCVKNYGKSNFYEQIWDEGAGRVRCYCYIDADKANYLNQPKLLRSLSSCSRPRVKN